MGLTMEFRAGDARGLARTFCDRDFAELERMSRASADFSLHLSPNDLDLLVVEIMESAGHAPITFMELTGEPIAGDRKEAGVFIVATSLVRTVAALPDAQVNGVVERWFYRISEESGDPNLNATADAVLAVSELLKLCRQAVGEHLQVVYCWSL